MTEVFIAVLNEEEGIEHTIGEVKKYLPDPQTVLLIGSSSGRWRMPLKHKHIPVIELFSYWEHYLYNFLAPYVT